MGEALQKLLTAYALRTVAITCLLALPVVFLSPQLATAQSNEPSATPATEAPAEKRTVENEPAPSEEANAPASTTVAPAEPAAPEAPKSKIREAFEANRKAEETTEAKQEEPAKAESPAEKIEKEIPKLVVASWSGAYGEAQRQAIIEPVSRNLGIEIVRKGAGAGTGDADVQELDQSGLLAACKAGKVIELNDALNSQPQDFLTKAAGKCGVPTFAWSSLLIANTEAMKKLARRRYRMPNRIEHLIDTKRYPGKRALLRQPQRILEMLLLADGVPRGELYARLATRQGQDRAFELLEQLNKHILWVDGPKEAMLALDSGQATLAMSYSGRAFRRLIASQLQPIWDGHIMDFASWAISAQSRRPEEAKRFILAATTPESLAAQARLWPYGPMRRSALTLARRHALLDTDLEPFMPTSQLRYAQGIVLSARFWADEGDNLQKRFEDWQNGVPLGIRVPVPRQAPPPPLPPVPRQNG